MIMPILCQEIGQHSANLFDKITNQDTINKLEKIQ